MFVSLFSLLVYGKYNKNALQSTFVCISITLKSSTVILVHPIVSGVWPSPLVLSPTLDLSQARHKRYICYLCSCLQAHFSTDIWAKI